MLSLKLYLIVNVVTDIVHEGTAAADSPALIELSYQRVALLSLGGAAYKCAEVSLFGFEFFLRNLTGLQKQRPVFGRKQTMSLPVRITVALIIFSELVGSKFLGLSARQIPI